MATESRTRTLLRTRDVMDRRFNEPLDVAELAAIAHLSPSHFLRQFKLTFGETPHQYLYHPPTHRARWHTAALHITIGHRHCARGRVRVAWNLHPNLHQADGTFRTAAHAGDICSGLPAGAGERGAPPRCCLSLPGEPGVKTFYRFVSELADDGIPVTVSLRVLKLSRQSYYCWLKHRLPQTGLIQAYRANALLDACRDDPEFGYRFLIGEAADADEVVCERTAWKICRNNQWWSVFGKKRGENGKRPGLAVHDDLVERDFSSHDANELWGTYITEHRIGQGRLYFCAVKEMLSGRIVGYSFSDRMKARLAVDALGNSMSRRRDAAGCIDQLSPPNSGHGNSCTL